MDCGHELHRSFGGEADGNSPSAAGYRDSAQFSDVDSSEHFGANGLDGEKGIVLMDGLADVHCVSVGLEEPGFLQTVEGPACVVEPRAAFAGMRHAIAESQGVLIGFGL